MLASAVEIFCDTLSASQIREQYRQVRFHDSLSNGYSLDGLMAYYWRDIVSIGLSTTVLLLAGYLTCILGVCSPQLIHPALINGRDYDRRAVMRVARDKRREYERLELNVSQQP